MSSDNKMSEKKEERDPLASEAASLRAELAMLRGRLNACRQANIGAQLTQTRPASYLSSKKESGNSEGGDPDMNAHLSIIVLGASGDLAVKKTYPALFSLFRHKLLPARFSIVGYARSKMSKDEFEKKISSKFGDKFDSNLKTEFLKNCWYHEGQYDSRDDMAALNTELLKVELKSLGLSENNAAINASPAESHKDRAASNRLFYLALPPTAFVPAAKSFHASAMSKRGWNRVVVEKPFGRDSQSSEELGRELSALFTEDQIYRIDHYLGKEMVQNLMVLRFANKILEPLWNRDHVNCIMITFKEDFGTQGRGGYFDSFGIIRDVMQNHLLQMLSIVCMEPPLSLSAEDVRDEKVKLLRSIAPITPDDTVIGQYTADPRGREPGYTDDKDVPKDSVTPTYAACVLHVNNSRWMGIPMIMKCGKALNEKRADIRIQFKHPINTLFEDISPNELVLRVGPDEAVYLKLTTKEPGLEGGNRHTELDLTYKKRFEEEMKDMPDAYERLILDVIRGDHNLFVRADELAAAWRIFTPLLHAIEKDKVLKPIKYEFGSRGPVEADKLVANYGYILTHKYQWEPPSIDRNQSKSPTPQLAAATLQKYEPQPITEFVRLIESGLTKDNLGKMIELFTKDATVESGNNAPKSPHDFYATFLPSLAKLRILVKHRFVDTTKPTHVAIHFTGEGEIDGKQVRTESIDMIELSEDGKRIQKLIILSDGPRAKL